jgi:hypothetical protein
VVDFGTDRDWLRWDGNGWNLERTGTNGAAWFWGLAPSDVWSAGDDLRHFNGTTWNTVLSGAKESCVHGTSTANIWTCRGRHYNGSTWSSPSPTHSFSQVFATPTEVWGIAQGAYRLENNDWILKPHGDARRMAALWISPSGVVWAASGTTLYRYDRETWTPVTISTLVGNINTLWGTGDEDIWVGTEEGDVWRYSR